MSCTPLRILLSAYACEPGKGSEPEVGWQWATGLARRGHEVWVLTRANNRESIEAALPTLNLPNLHFVYFDLPSWIIRIKRWIGINLYYRLWQGAALPRAKALHAQVGFQRAHHVTFVVIRHPSFLRHLGVPYVLGPVAGGDYVPRNLMAGLPLFFKLEEWLRHAANWIFIRSPSVRHTLARADMIVANSKQTAALIPKALLGKVVVRLAITAAPPVAVEPRCAHSPFRTLFVGRLVHLKGVHLAIRATAVANRNGTPIRLTILGDGPAQEWLRALASSEGCSNMVDFLPWQPRHLLPAIYSRHDALVFASLRDSGGMVAFEGMEHGLPVVGLKLGGPGQIIDEQCGCAVEPTSIEQTVDDLAHCLVRLATDAAAYRAASAGAVRRLGAFSQSRLFSDLGY